MTSRVDMVRKGLAESKVDIFEMDKQYAPLKLMDAVIWRGCPSYQFQDAACLSGMIAAQVGHGGILLQHGPLDMSTDQEVNMWVVELFKQCTFSRLPKPGPR